MGDATAAEAHAAKVKQLDANFSYETFLPTLHYARPEDTAHLIEGLVKAKVFSAPPPASAPEPVIQPGADASCA
jgi:adenylate cyclase